MKASDLRIGNLVYSVKEIDHGDRVPVLVVGIDTKHITYLCENHQLHSEIRQFHVGPNQIYPIPLTKIWLDKMKFQINYNFTVPGSNRIFYIKDDFEIVDMNGVFTYGETNLKYLHQLQNLYFALTNEELTA